MPDELDVSFNESITVAQRDALLQRLKTAWANLPPATQAALKPMLDDGHQQLAALVEHGTPPDSSTHQTLGMKSYLTGDWDGHLASLGQPINLSAAQPLASPVTAEAIEIKVGSEGEILGTGKYQQLDPRWELVAGTVWLEHILHKQPFPSGAPSILPMDSQVRLVMVGDYGTGNFGSGDSPAVKISKFIPSLNPDYTIHLGDTYYAGTGSEESSKLLSLWPQGSKGSFALNSNHEMYSSGGPYFNEVVGGPIFNKLQSPYSFFALENDHWIVVGLDSAYYSSALTLYLDGTLGSNNAQTAFLQEVAKRGKKVIVITHHNGIPVGGFDPTTDKLLQLYTDVMNAFTGSPAPAYWYYGHEHVGAAYAPLKGSEMLCRCLGHGALPWGFASSLQTAQDSGLVEWFEKCNAADPDDNLRVFNGFVSLDLDGPDLVETFYDETGRVTWSPGNRDKRC
ncbi:hypothetical protein HNQ77_000986 [Silvibacterium bohemicum]|uniref:Calcineurin-like phosphoesterase domain-containing protein n=1 Tax=Silvibacterium bohemicum TaxID=1577686 RepID=A0A841JNU7_9BACT|nr:metallophosphoesterase [Silvibacterium bohemicum]MBB6143042.1 hypothetical protein [Silvibacterium bohemicum]